MGAINRNGPLNMAILQRQPEPVAFAVITFTERDKFPCNLALKRQAKSHECAVVLSVKFNDSADGARQVTFVNGQRHDGYKKNLLSVNGHGPHCLPSARKIATRLAGLALIGFGLKLAANNR